MDKGELLEKIASIALVAGLSAAGLFFLEQRFYELRQVPADGSTVPVAESATLEFGNGHLFATTSEPLTSGVMIPVPDSVPELVYAPKILASDGVYFKKKLHEFSYTRRGPQMLEIAGSCSDTYYATLIFSIIDDYSKNPSSAKYNQAETCPKSKSFDKLIDLSGANLAEGKYYFFVADQGVNRSWYNPR